MAKPQSVIIDYTNHRGERRERKILPMDIEFASNQYHPEQQWLLTALDMERADGVERTFALANIHSWKIVVA